MRPTTIPTSARLKAGHQPKSMKSVTAHRRRMSTRFPVAPPSAAPAPILASSVCSPAPVRNSIHTEMNPIAQPTISDTRPRRCPNVGRTVRTSRMRTIDDCPTECDDRVRTHNLVPWSSARTRMPATRISTGRGPNGRRKRCGVNIDANHLPLFTHARHRQVHRHDERAVAPVASATVPRSVASANGKGLAASPATARPPGAGPFLNSATSPALILKRNGQEGCLMWRAVTSIVAALTLSSSAAAAQQPCTTDARRVVAEVYRHTLERGADRGAQSWARQLANGELNVKEFVRTVAQSQEYMQRFGQTEPGEERPYERAVARLYRHVLGRQPDVSGLRNWTRTAQQRGLPAVVDGLVDSAEYRNRFGEFGVPGSGGLRYCTDSSPAQSSSAARPFRGLGTSGRAIAVGGDRQWVDTGI